MTGSGKSIVASERRLVVFNHYAVTPESAGGTRHYDIGRMLAGRGYDVTIVASASSRGDRSCQHFADGHPFEVQTFGDAPGLRFVWVRTVGGGRSLASRSLAMLSYWPRAQSVVRQLLRDGVIPKPSWVVGSCVHQFAGLAGLGLAREYRVPFIYEVRDLWPETLTSVGHWSPYSPPVVLSRQLSRYLYRKADHIVTLLPGSEGTIASYGVRRERISSIPNGVDLYRASGVTPMRPCGTEGKFLVTYAGSHGRANALSQLLSAAKILQTAGHSEVSFLLVGSGPEKELLRTRAIAEGVLNVSFLDPIPKKDIYAVLNASDAFFLGTLPLTLYNAGMSMNKLMDYFAVGRPIVLACNSPINLVAESGAGIVVPSNSPQELADAFLHLLQMSQDERSAMGRRGQEYARQHHSVEHLADLWEGVFECLS